MRAHGRNGTFEVHETLVSGSVPGICFVDLLARRSTAKSPPAFLQGTKAELIQWLKDTLDGVERIKEAASG